MKRIRRHKKKFSLSIVILSIFVTVLLLNKKFLDNGMDIFTGHKIFVNKQPRNANGFLNIEIWEDICGYEILSLKEFPLFPHGPSTRLTTSSLRMNFKREFENFGLRIFGFLSPSESANYTFHLVSSGSSELWMSLDSKSENSKLIANVTLGSSWNDERNIPLFTGKRYFLEILHKHGRHDRLKLNHIHLRWRSSSWKDHNLRDIPSEVLSAFEGDNDLTGFDNLSIPSPVGQQVDLPMHIKHRDPSFVYKEAKRRAEIYRLPFVNEEDTQDLFPPCQYNPSYIVKKPLERYQAMWETHYTSIYPFDYTDITDKGVGNYLSFGNDQMDENTAMEIVSQVWTRIQSKNPGKYSLQHTLNVEENHDQGTGDRYLVELELKEISSGKSVRFSEYLYRPWGTHALCTPVGVAWNKSAVINILLTTGNNQGRWILHFLDNMAKIHKKTKDSKFNVIITDFDSKDLDLEKALNSSELPHFQYKKINDTFQRALGLQLAANMVTDPNSILFTMDLHLDIPYHFLDDVRKHCVQSKVVYTPLLVRLSCGATTHQLSGRWEIQGYGLMAIYKTDWDRIGGMNVEEFKDKWGGEDWEICDRIFMDGMEIERLKMMHLFHYFHTNKGLWTSASNTIQDQSEQYWL